jgi:hypothetical protein
MPTEVERKLSEQDKALAAELGRAIAGTVRDLPTTMPGAPTHTPSTRGDGNSQAERYRSLAQDQEKRPAGSLSQRMNEQREKQAARPEPAKSQEQERGR